MGNLCWPSKMGHVFLCEFLKLIFFRQMAAHGYVWEIKILHSSQIFCWSHENAGKCVTRLSSLRKVFPASLPATSALISRWGWNSNHADALAQKKISQIFGRFGPHLCKLRAFLCPAGPYFAVFADFPGNRSKSDHSGPNFWLPHKKCKILEYGTWL